MKLKTDGNLAMVGKHLLRKLQMVNLTGKTKENQALTI